MNDTELFNTKKWYLGRNIGKWVNCFEPEVIGKLVQKRESEIRNRIEEDMTNLFTLCFLNPGIKWYDWATTESKTAELEDFYSWSNIHIIKERVINMPYKDFLNTLYWDLVRTIKKENVNYKCELCNCNHNLAVHHKTYENHGDEYHHLEDLIVLCSDCHAKFHDKFVEAEK